MEWMLKQLDGEPIEAFAVVDKRMLPAGVDVTVIEDIRSIVATGNGPTEIQNGDWLVRHASGAIERLAYDEAAARIQDIAA